jgi:hypothetical protein
MATKQSSAREARQNKKRGNHGKLSSFFLRACRRELDCFASLAIVHVH